MTRISHTDRLVDILDKAPIRTLNQARDYRRDDRLVRRLRVGTQFYAAELVGYQDRYHPAVRFDGNSPSATCTCSRRMPCAHAVALLLDLAEVLHLFLELPWALRNVLETSPTAWLLDQPFPWERIPQEAPAWRLPPDGRAPHWLPTGDTRSPLSRDGATPIFAEMHPGWLENAAVERRLGSWIEQRLDQGRDEAYLWVQLAWFQPALPLTPVWMTFAGNGDARLAMLQQLMAPSPYWHATPFRRVSLLRALTVVDRLTATPFWDIFRSDDPNRLAQADSLYLSGDQAGACRVLEEHLPEDPEARRKVRARLIAWLSPAEALPHRLALALESGESSWAIAVQDTVNSDAWNLFSRAFRERWQVSPEGPDSP